MVEIVLTGRSPVGEAAIMLYHNEKLTFLEKLRANKAGVVSARKIISENPLVHITTIHVHGKNSAAFNSQFKEWKERNVLLYETKMLDYGATASDYSIEVRR